MEDLNSAQVQQPQEEEAKANAKKLVGRLLTPAEIDSVSGAQSFWEEFSKVQN